MNCTCTATTENKKNTLKVRKGNTLKLKLKYTINGSPASIESFNKTRFYLINPYQIKREITNYNVPRRFDDEVEISLTEDVIGRYSIEMVYRDNNDTQATYDFEDVFEIVGKSSEETDITDSEFINKEVSLNGYLRVGYDDEALDRRIGDLPNFAMMRGTMFIINNEVEKIKEQLSTGGNGCDCETKIKHLQEVELFNLHMEMNERYNELFNKIDERYQELFIRIDERYNELFNMIDMYYRELSITTNNHNSRLENVEDELKKKQTATPVPDVSAPLIVIPTTQPPTPTPPNNDGGSDRYDIPVDNPFEPIDEEI